MILIILSTITIHMTFGENGLVEKAEQAKNMTEDAAKKEQEGMANAVAYINEIIYGSGSTGEETDTNEEPAVNEEPIINEVEPDTNTVEPPPVEVPDAEGNVQFGEIVWSDGQASVTISTTTEYTIEYQKNETTGSWTVITNGETLEGLNHGDIIYVRLADGENAGKETSIRITDSIAPQVTVTPGTITSSTIKVEINAVDNESGMLDEVTYTYYIKKTGEKDTAYVNEGSNTNANYTFTGLEQGTSYDIKVEAKSDKAGNKGEGTLLNQSTVSIPGGETGLEEGAISFGAPTWSSGTAVVAVSTNMPDYILEYQVSTSTPADEGWTTISNNGNISGINHGETVYARLTDGTNYGEYASITITDTQVPTVEIEVGEVTSNSIKVTVNATDNETGLATTDTYKYYLNDEETARETSISNTYTFAGLAGETEYNIKVEVIDKAGNIGSNSTTATTKTQMISDIVGGEEFTDTTTVIDGIGNDVVIPGGFKVASDSGTNVEEGIVIEDSKGNQFVWIPTGTYQTSSGAKTNNLSRRTFSSAGATKVSGDNVIERYCYGEGDSRSVAYSQIGAFKDSVSKNGGFYIGRYEQGTGNVCKEGVAPYTNITRDTAKSQAEAMYRGNSYVVSELISSYAWDTALNFICQTNSAGYTLAITTSSSYGNIGTGSKKNTGIDANDNYSNIHDLLGNCMEWTTGYSSYSGNPCVSRGGNYSSGAYYAAKRVYPSTSGSYDDVSARLQLYVK